MIRRGKSEKKTFDSSSNEDLLRELRSINKSVSLRHGDSPTEIPSRGPFVSRKSQFFNAKPKTTGVDAKENPIQKEKKSTSIWNWKPLKSLSGNNVRKFNCCFTLHVHSVEGLPMTFDDSSLHVVWKRSDRCFQTRPSKVSQGVAVFGDSLEDRSYLQGSFSGSQYSAKYDAKQYLLYISLVGSPDLDLGKHRIDLTRLLPLTMEELDGEGSSGEWTTSFKLSGKAKGATLNVSFEYFVSKDKPNVIPANKKNLDSSIAKQKGLRNSMTVSEQYQKQRFFQRGVASAHRERNILHSQSLEEVKILHEVSPTSRSEAQSSVSTEMLITENFVGKSSPSLLNSEFGLKEDGYNGVNLPPTPIMIDNQNGIMKGTKLCVNQSLEDKDPRSFVIMEPLEATKIFDGNCSPSFGHSESDLKGESCFDAVNLPLRTDVVEPIKDITREVVGLCVNQSLDDEDSRTFVVTENSNDDCLPNLMHSECDLKGKNCFDAGNLPLRMDIVEPKKDITREVVGLCVNQSSDDEDSRSFVVIENSNDDCLPNLRHSECDLKGENCFDAANLPLRMDIVESKKDITREIVGLCVNQSSDDEDSRSFVATENLDDDHLPNLSHSERDLKQENRFDAVNIPLRTDMIEPKNDIRKEARLCRHLSLEDKDSKSSVTIESSTQYANFDNVSSPCLQNSEYNLKEEGQFDPSKAVINHENVVKQADVCANCNSEGEGPKSSVITGSSMVSAKVDGDCSPQIESSTQSENFDGVCSPFLQNSEYNLKEEDCFDGVNPSPRIVMIEHENDIRKESELSVIIESIIEPEKIDDNRSLYFWHSECYLEEEGSSDGVNVSSKKVMIEDENDIMELAELWENWSSEDIRLAELCINCNSEYKDSKSSVLVESSVSSEIDGDCSQCLHHSNCDLKKKECFDGLNHLSKTVVIGLENDIMKEAELCINWSSDIEDPNSENTVVEDGSVTNDPIEDMTHATYSAGDSRNFVEDMINKDESEIVEFSRLSPIENLGFLNEEKFTQVMINKESTMEENDATFHNLSIMEEEGFWFPESEIGILQKDYLSSHLADFGDNDNIVASEFLDMLGIGNSQFGDSFESDPESPRERLWKEFEKDYLSNGDTIFGLDICEEIEFDRDDDEVQSTSMDFSELFFSVHSEEEQNEKMQKETESRTRAQMMEELETEALMRDWGLNEKAFQDSPPKNVGDLGSFGNSPSDELFDLPPLGEGLGPYLQTKDGGFLRSMNPSLFQNAKNNGSLIMQVSNPIVVPAEMGSGVMDILQRLALVGIEKLSMQANKLMHLEDITGKSMSQIAWEAASTTMEMQEPSENLTQEAELFEHKMDAPLGKKRRAKPFSGEKSSTETSLSDYVSLENLAPLAMDKIEALSIEGLKIQSDMSEGEEPSNVNPQSVRASTSVGGSTGFEGAAGLQLLDIKVNGDDVDGLMGLSITLDEWMRLDSGIVTGEDEISSQTSKILAAHHAKTTDFLCGGKNGKNKGGRNSGKRWGLLGNNFTVALMVQLRDPLRNYEPVGSPMLSLIQVERVFVPPKPRIYDTLSFKGNGEIVDEPEATTGQEENREEEKEKEFPIPQFKITEVHVAGLKTEPSKKKLWGNASREQSGSRWLLANGMGKKNKNPLLKGKSANQNVAPTVTVNPGETLWSISSKLHGIGAKWKEFTALNSHKRNPNVILPNEII